MNINDLQMALPIYNLLFQLNNEIRSLKDFLENIKKSDVICIELHNKGTGSVPIQEITGDFKIILVQSLINFKIEQKISCEKSLERI